MEIRMRPKSNYMHQASLQELYVLTEHWQSDLQFYTDELQFLHHLLDKYFIWMVEDVDISNVQKMMNKLSKADEECKNLSEQVARHLSHLTELEQNPFAQDEKKFRNEHANLEDKIADFTKAFRSVKKEVFKITEHLMETDKLKHLLTP